MDARAVVELALRGMIAQDIQEHMRWIDDEVRLDSSVALPLTAKLRYLQECAPVLAPGTGIRLTRYEITEVGAPGPDGQWIAAILMFEAPKDGKLFPTGPVEYATQTSRAWYAVRAERIVHVKTQSLPQALHFSLP